MKENRKPVKAIVLAAGKGTRLRTEGVDLPKVMRLANGVPLLGHVLAAVGFLAPQDVVLVGGYQREKVFEAFPNHPAAVQEPQMGTGHAVQCAKEALEGFEGDILVCYGDMPLMTEDTYRALIETHKNENNLCTLLSAHSQENLPYGRIVRHEDGSFFAIVEDKDCTSEQKAIQELNVGVYVFDSKALWEALDKIKPNNAQGEYYLTDAPTFILEQGGKVGVCDTCAMEEMLGVNTVEQLAQVEDFLKSKENN